MIQSKGYAAYQEKEDLKPFDFTRRDVGDNDVLIDILYCGVCHTDIHHARNDWHRGNYPMVPGHEIIGKITQTGANVSKFKMGDTVGVGCIVDSCKNCGECDEDLEQYCAGKVLTYNYLDPKTGDLTKGGYANNIVVDQGFVLSVPDNLDMAGAAPLLCAGITTYSPLKHWNVNKASKVGVVGLGGLGHMAVKLAVAMGAHVTVFTTSQNKIDDAKKLGADHVVLSKNLDEMQSAAGSLDLIIDTVSAVHDVDSYLLTLKRDGTLVFVGLPSEPLPAPTVGNLVFARRSVAGSLMGGLKETQEMLDFCGQHNITSDIEMINIQDINTAYERVLKSDVKYRFVIDMSGL